MCSVVLGQCDMAMQVKLQVTEDWDANKTYMLFVLKAAQAACISVQDNYSMHAVAREVVRSLTNCFQNSDTALAFKQKYLATKKNMDKAGISFKFAKKFLDLKKKKNLKLDDAAATEAAKKHFLGTMWLLNSKVPHSVTDNLVQDHISGNDNYPESVDRAFTMVSVIKEAFPVTQVTPLPPWLKQTKLAVDNTAEDDQVVATTVAAEVAPDEAWGTVVIDQERNQAE